MMKVKKRTPVETRDESAFREEVNANIAIYETEFGELLRELDSCCKDYSPGRGKVKKGIELLKRGFEIAGSDEMKKGLLVEYAVKLGFIAEANEFYEESKVLYEMAKENYTSKSEVPETVITKSYKNAAEKVADNYLNKLRNDEIDEEDEVARYVFDIYLELNNVEKIYEILIGNKYFPRSSLTVDQLQKAGILLINDMEKNIGEFALKKDSFLRAMARITAFSSVMGENPFIKRTDETYTLTELGEAFKNLWDSMSEEKQRDIKDVIQTQTEEPNAHGYQLMWATFFDEDAPTAARLYTHNEKRRKIEQERIARLEQTKRRITEIAHLDRISINLEDFIKGEEGYDDPSTILYDPTSGDYLNLDTLINNAKDEELTKKEKEVALRMLNIVKDRYTKIVQIFSDVYQQNKNLDAALMAAREEAKELNDILVAYFESDNVFEFVKTLK
ncbi:hypothetical protein J7K41_00625 [Candidatus Micrarchaeota archaeon]|nr:hypothetical protein [Candidatus Micrarchaeota archaeon]